MKEILNFIAKKTSYTFAIAFVTVMVIGISTIFGYFMGIAFITSSYYELIFDDMLKWFPVSAVVVSFFYFIYFGLLTPFKIPAFAKPLRLINDSFYGSELKKIDDSEELKELLEHLSFLPIYNTIASVLFIIAFGLLMSSLLFIDNMIAGTFSLRLVSDVMSTGFIGSGVTSIVAGMVTYLLTDMITSREKTACYNELRSRDYRIPPIANIRISIKLGFFLVLMIIALLIFGAQIERGRYYGEAEITSIVFYFIVTVFIGFLLMYINSNSILRIIADLRRVAREIAQGGEGKFEFLPSESEFADIEYTIMEMKREIDENRKTLEMKVEDRTKELQVALTDLKEKDDLVQRQLDMASTIQRGILPGKIEPWNGLRFAVRYIAMEKIGGDFYDVYQLDGNKISLLVADVSGHGIPAAFVTAMAKLSFNSAHLKNDSPKKIFQEVNHEMLDHVKTQDYLTCFLLVIDDEYKVTYANASHQKAMLIRTAEGKIELMDTGGLFIGAIEEANDTYEEKEIKLGYGDRIILYTDGIPEAVNEEKEEYSNERLERIVLDNKDLDIEELADTVILDLQNFMGTAPMQDDITLFVIELEKDESLEVIREVKKLTGDNKFHEAINRLEEGLVLFPDNEKLLYNLGKTYFRVNEFKKATDAFNSYIDLNNTNKYAFYICGTAYYQMKDMDNAIRYFEDAIRLDQTFVNSIFAAGMAYKKKGDKDEAVRCFERVIDIEGTNKRARKELDELRGE